MSSVIPSSTELATTSTTIVPSTTESPAEPTTTTIRPTTQARPSTSAEPSSSSFSIAFTSTSSSAVVSPTTIAPPPPPQTEPESSNLGWIIGGGTGLVLLSLLALLGFVFFIRKKKRKNSLTGLDMPLPAPFDKPVTMTYNSVEPLVPKLCPDVQPAPQPHYPAPVVFQSTIYDNVKELEDLQPVHVQQIYPQVLAPNEQVGYVPPILYKKRGVPVENDTEPVGPFLGVAGYPSETLKSSTAYPPANHDTIRFGTSDMQSLYSSLPLPPSSPLPEVPKPINTTEEIEMLERDSNASIPPRPDSPLPEAPKVALPQVPKDDATVDPVEQETLKNTQ